MAAGGSRPAPTAGSARRPAWEYVVALCIVAVLAVRIETLGGGSLHNTDSGLSRGVRETEVNATLLARIAALEDEVRSLVSSKKRGPTGPPGTDGLDGERGPRGYRGPQGIPGKTGPTGKAGSAGKDGRDGFCAVLNGTTGEVQVPCPAGGGGGGGYGPAADSESVEKLKGIVAGLTRQLVIQQVMNEQRVRFEGGSGITQVRGYNGGSQPFHETSFTNVGFANFHNHANHKYTIGMGEIAAVLNGVEFWTRHNDYALRQPSATSESYHATEPIELPKVPPEVLARASGCGSPPCINDQAEEMRRWFHAWQDQDPACPSCKKLDDAREAQNLTRFDAPGTERHFANYFQPILCYLEGTWIKATDDIEEPFHSDRHFIDAKTWRELYDKNRYMLQSGRKSSAENLPFLPMSVRETGLNDSEPVFATWEYRIACHRLKDPVPLDRFRVSPDLQVQLKGGQGGLALSLRELEDSRYARFDLNPNNASRWWEGARGYQYIDQLMEEIPGKDNYPGKIADDTFSVNLTHIDRREEVLNTAYYSRFYAVNDKDAMGRNTGRRGFNDPTLWAAQTTQERVAGVTACVQELADGDAKSKDCDPTNTKEQKYSWAIPIEVVYLTPLSHWNPYDIRECDEGDRKCEDSVVAWGADGTPAKPFNGTTTRNFYITPQEFFTDVEDKEVDAADTSGGVTTVLDQQGVPRKVRAAGHWIHFPAIKTFDRPIRQRFPIMPVHAAGGQDWREIKALQALSIGLGNTAFNARYLNSLDKINEEREGVDMVLTYTSNAVVGGHSHTFHLTPDHLALLDGEPGYVELDTTQNNGHRHRVKISRTPETERDGRVVYSYEMLTCDQQADCWDGHPDVRQE